MRLIPAADLFWIFWLQNVIVGGGFFGLFWGPFSLQPSRSVRYLRFHCSRSSRDGLTEKARITGDGARMRLGDVGEKSSGSVYLDLNRIPQTKAVGGSSATVVTTNPCHILTELEEPTWAEIQPCRCSAVSWMFASCCLISVAARRTLNFPTPRCCCSNLFLSTQNATFVMLFMQSRGSNLPRRAQTCTRLPTPNL